MGTGRRVLWLRQAFLGSRVALGGMLGTMRRFRQRAVMSGKATMSPDLALSMCNLAQAGPGHRIADPCCGSGALLLWAAVLGAETFASDIQAAELEGIRQNFLYHRLPMPSFT